MAGTDSSDRSPQITPDINLDYADAASPNQLHDTITTDVDDLWIQNEQLFVWLLRNGVNALLRTVPAGGKSYCKETVVPQVAYETGRTFVLATTEYRNRQETCREVLETLIEYGLVDDLNVVYLPSPREEYGNIPRLVQDAHDGWRVTTPDEDEAVCQTFTTDENHEYRHGIAEEMDEYVARGSTTGAIHKAISDEWKQTQPPFYTNWTQSPLRCQEAGVKQGYDPTNPDSEPACRHRRLLQRRLEKIKAGDADIVICGASFLNLPDIVQDATVLCDEDVSGELVSEYTEGYLENAAENYLSGIEIGPDTYKGVLKASDEATKTVADHIRDNHAPRVALDADDDRDPLVNQNAPLKSETYHYDRAEAPLLALALLEADQTEHTKHLVFNPEDIPYTVALDLESTNANNNHDPVAIARPPQPLQAAEQVIGLDATGSQDWWELITGVDFEVMSPNPLDKRGTVVAEAFDIEFRQLTENMVPINRPDNLSAREFLGIVQAVADEHDAEEVSIVTSKAMKRKIENSEYAEEVMELAYADTILYFNGLRSDRTFEKSRLHVVIGAPHPGDDAVRQRMALLRYDDRIVQNNSTLRGEDRYQGDARRALEDIVYSEIYQAARRAARDFDRDETAYVYLYTRMFDNTLLPTDDRYSVEIFGQGEKLDGGTEAILAVLDEADRSITTTKIDERVSDRMGNSPAYRTITEKLNNLADYGVVEKIPWIGQTKKWELYGSARHGKLVTEPK